MHRIAVIATIISASTANSEQNLKSWQLSIDGSTRGGLVAEAWGTSNVEYLDERDSSGVFEGVRVKGSNRLFAISDFVWAHHWHDVSYKHFSLLNRGLTFTLDLSAVGCGCNAAVYLVQMTEPDSDGPGYCDIAGYESEFDTVRPCLEIDLLLPHSIFLSNQSSALNVLGAALVAAHRI